jgi:hypothetical protein
MAPEPRKTSGKCGCGRKSFDSGSQTSTLELALAKPMKHSNKFVVKSSGLSVAEKAIASTVEVVSKKTHSASAGGRGMIWALMCALDLFGSSSSSSDNKMTLQEPPHKHPKGVLKPSVSKGNFK